MSNNKNSGKMKVLYMIFSIAVAIALWTYVAYIENPMLESPIAVSNVPVELTGDEALRDRNLIVSNVDVKELTVYFGGRRRDSAAIAKMDVKAVVDLTDVFSYSTPTGTHALDYELVYETNSSSLTVERVSRPVVEVTVERLVTDTITLEPVMAGTIADGYMAGDITLSRPSVDVAGTEAAISKIARATVTMRGENLSRTTSETDPIVFWDEEGNEIDREAEGLTLVNSDGTSVITQNILMVKEVPLVIDVVDSNTASDANITKTINPSTVTLAGDPEVLEGLSNINLGTVDLKTVYMTFEETYRIIWPNNTQSLSGETVATVKIDVTDSSVDLWSVSASNIGYRNARDTDYVTIITQSLDIFLRGNARWYNNVDQKNIRIVADLTNYAGNYGIHTVPARVYVDGFTDVEAVGEYKVTVSISDTPPQPDTVEPAPETEPES